MAINNNNSSFNGPVYQSEGDQFINAGHNGVMNVTMLEARRAATELRAAVAGTYLPPGHQDDARRQLAEIEAGLGRPDPRPGKDRALPGSTHSPSRVRGGPGGPRRGAGEAVGGTRPLAG